MKRQRTLFGGFTKKINTSYAIYKKPKEGYESFVERFCLRRKKENPHESKESLVGTAQIMWKDLKNDEAKLKEFEKLLKGEIDFKRYG